MNFRTILALAVACSLSALASSCGNKNAETEQQLLADQPIGDKPAKEKGGKVGGPQLGTPGGGPVIDKTGDPVLQAMIRTEVPEFKQLEFTDSETGETIRYNLFSPRGMDETKAYPLFLFMADASTPGTDITRPLTQGYGALVWATDEFQTKNPLSTNNKSGL